jgi:hypothetical protein
MGRSTRFMKCTGMSAGVNARESDSIPALGAPHPRSRPARLEAQRAILLRCLALEPAVSRSVTLVR